MGGGLRLRGGLERVAGCPPLLEQEAARRLQRAEERAHLAAISPPYFPGISPISRPYLAHISTVSPQERVTSIKRKLFAEECAIVGDECDSQ